MTGSRWRECVCLDDADRETLEAVLARALPHAGELTPAEFDLINDIAPTALGDAWMAGHPVIPRETAGTP